MEKLLYPIDEVVSRLKGGDFIKNSKFLKVVALMPASVDGKARLVNVSSILVKGQSFSSRVDELRSLMPGGDIYYEIDDVEETKDIREDLDLSKTVVSLDNNGLCTISHKDYYVMYPIEGISDELDKRIRDLNLTLSANVWVIDDGGSISFEYNKPSSTISHLSRAGYLLKASDIQKIYDAGLNELLLSDDNFEVFSQHGEQIRKVPFDDKVMKKYPGKVSVKPAKTSSKIQTYYEFDPMEEKAPTFGELVEIEPVSTLGGETVWKITPKIVQNESGYEFAERAAEKGIRVAVTMPDEVRDELEQEGKGAHIKEFINAPGMGNRYFIEKGISLYEGKHFKK